MKHVIAIIAFLVCIGLCRSDDSSDAERLFAVAQKEYLEQCQIWLRYYQTGRWNCTPSRAEIMRGIEKYRMAERYYILKWRELQKAKTSSISNKPLVPSKSSILPRP